MKFSDIELQVNCQKDKKIKELVFSKRLASIARQLMQVKGVRLYHDII